MSKIKISYYSDVLCIWAYASQRRLNELAKKFGSDISIHAHFCSIFPDAWGKIEKNWKDKGGFEGFNSHISEAAKTFTHVQVHDRLWLETKPRTSESAHLFLKAIEIIEQETTPDQQEKPYLERVTTQAAWEIRHEFFANGRDISNWRVLSEIASRFGVEYAHVEEKIYNSQAVAQLANDYILSREHAVEGSPTFIMNDGRQKLFGNVGYRLLEANVQELLRSPSNQEASWC